MRPVLLDTHALVWAVFEPGLLSASASEAIRQAISAGNPIYISAISLVEICYLVEKGRLPQATITGLQQALSHPEPKWVTVALDWDLAGRVADIPRDLVPDMPDRIIAATALHLGVALVTQDAKLRAANIQTIW